MTYTCPTCGEIYKNVTSPTVCYECGEYGYNFIHEIPKSNTCEWCRMTYPIGGWDYYEVVVFKRRHVICSDCYDKLELVKVNVK